MSAKNLIYNHFFKKFENRKIGNVGCELEFPLVNKSGGDVDKDFARGVFDYFSNRGFKCAEDEGYFFENAHGDVISFDNSYNNFEFSLCYGNNLCEIKKRFDEYFAEAQNYFSRENYELIGRGTNPNKSTISQNRAEFSTYNMVDDFLKTYGKDTKFPDFPAYLSSVQTHLDVDLQTLPTAYTYFAKLDFVRAILFSNSPDFDKKGYRCYRDFLWEQSAFSKCSNITGKVDAEFETADALVSYFLEKDMFNRKRNGKYEIFAPVNIKEYFENEKYGAKDDDIDCYLSFKNVEITARGTLEVRSDCTQPLDSSFAPCAFNLGILCNLDSAISDVDGFFDENSIAMSNTELRNIVVSGKKLNKICDEDILSDFVYDLVEIAAEALEKRGLGEEKLIEPLYKRAVTLRCPADAEYGNQNDTF